MSKIIYITDILSNNNFGRCTGHYIPVAKNYCSILKQCGDVRIAAGHIYGNAFNANQMMWLPYSVSSKHGICSNVKGKIQSLINCYYFIKAADKNSLVIWQQSTAITSCVGLWLFCHRKDINIYMIQYSETALNKPLKRFLYKRAKNKIRGLICPNEKVGEAYELPYCVVPDYIYTGEFDDVEPIPFEKRIYDICIVGRFNKDKGIVEAIERFKGTKYKVIVAGRPDSELYGKQIREASQNYSNIELHLGFIETSDYNNYIRNSKYCILNYQGEYSIRSSGVVYDIIFNGVPVIGSKCSALQFISEFKIGVLYNTIEKLELISLMNNEKYEEFLRNINEYRKYHKSYISKIHKFLEM